MKYQYKHPGHTICQCPRSLLPQNIGRHPHTLPRLRVTVRKVKLPSPIPHKPTMRSPETPQRQPWTGMRIRIHPAHPEPQSQNTQESLPGTPRQSLETTSAHHRHATHIDGSSEMKPPPPKKRAQCSWRQKKNFMKTARQTDNSRCQKHI